MKEKIGFIGFGSMGQALADGLLAAGIVKKEQLYACAQHWEKLKHNTEIRGMHACKTAEDTILQSDIILIAIKPDQIPEVLGFFLIKLSFLSLQVCFMIPMSCCYYQRHTI